MTKRVNEEFIKDIFGGYNLFGCRDCEGVSCCIFCYHTTGKLKLFNKDIPIGRFEKVMYDLISYGWYPKFTNAYELKGEKDWQEVYAPGIIGVSAKEAWKDIPPKMKEYIQSLPEYDEEIFRKITEE